MRMFITTLLFLHEKWLEYTLMIKTEGVLFRARNFMFLIPVHILGSSLWPHTRILFLTANYSHNKAICWPTACHTVVASIVLFLENTDTYFLLHNTACFESYRQIIAPSISSENSLNNGDKRRRTQCRKSAEKDNIIVFITCQLIDLLFMVQ